METCEIRMEPRLRPSATNPAWVPLAPPPLLFSFAFVLPDPKQEGMSKNDELKAFLGMVYVHRVTERARQRVCDAL